MYSLKHKELLDPIVADELESLIARFSGVLQEEHTVEGAHLQQAIVSAAKAENAIEPPKNSDGTIQIINTNVAEQGQQWKSGPWTLDDLTLPTTAERNKVGIIPPKLTGGTYNDYTPDGIDNAILLEIEPDGSDVTLTGLKAISAKRLLLLRNRDSALDLILVHGSTSSTLGYRFDLPSSTNVTLAPGQNCLLYYDPNRGAWTTAITGYDAGGAGSLAISSVVKTATVSITEAQLEASNTTPVTIVSAVAGKILFPINVLAAAAITTNYTNSPTFSVRWNGLFAVGTLTSTATFALSVGANPRTVRNVMVGAGTSLDVSDASNAGLNIQGNADLTGAGVATMTVTTTYVEF